MTQPSAPPGKVRKKIVLKIWIFCATDRSGLRLSPSPAPAHVTHPRSTKTSGFPLLHLFWNKKWFVKLYDNFSCANHIISYILSRLNKTHDIKMVWFHLLNKFTWNTFCAQPLPNLKTWLRSLDWAVFYLIFMIHCLTDCFDLFTPLKSTALGFPERQTWLLP